jgi:PAS domain S-box-containing protein
VLFDLERFADESPDGRSNEQSVTSRPPYRLLAGTRGWIDRLRAGTIHRNSTHGRRRFSARAYYAALSVALLIPALLAAWWFADVSAASEQAHVEHNILAEAREVSNAVDREVLSTANVLRALASSNFLQDGDLEAFRRQVTELARDLKLQIVVRDLRFDKPSINTAARGGDLASGARAPLGEAEWTMLRAGRPVISNVFWAPLPQRYVAAVFVPVMANGALAHLMSVGIPAERFVEIIKQTNPAAEHVVTITDAGGKVVARSDRTEKFVGRSVGMTADELEKRPPEGTKQGNNLEGIGFRWGYVRSDVTCWNVSVGIAEYELRASYNRQRASFAGAGVLAVLATMIGAYQLGGRFSQSFGALGVDREPTREEFEVLFDHAPNGVAVVDSDGHIALLNRQIEQMFGFSRDELVGQPVEMLIPERLRRRHIDLRSTFSGAPSARPMGARSELFGRRKDGSEFPLEIGLSPISTPSGKLVMATVVDISKRRQAAERLSGALAERDDLRRRFLKAQEDERLRLSRELHDQTGQSLTAVMMELKRIEGSGPEAHSSRLRLLRLQLEQMGKALHHVAWELRPASIDELGLASALANYVSEWSEQCGLDADFFCNDPGVDGLANEIRTTLYRIVQEALTNIAKHTAAATSVSVVIDRLGPTLRLTVEDDGCGFDTASTETVNLRTGLGLAGMRERIALVGGDIEIESSPGVGTTIFVRIPLPGEKAAV